MRRGSDVAMARMVALVMVLLQSCVASFLPFPPGPPPVSTTERPRVPATYWVTFSTQIRPGLRVPVRVHLLRAGDTTSVSVSLVKQNNHSVVFAHTPAVSLSADASPHTLYLEIPRDLEQPDWRNWFQYAINVVAKGDVNFNQTQTVRLYEKSFSIFVQTDKAIYKPGQTVKLRALAMKPDLTVMKEPMDIFIRDSLGNGIKRWLNVTGYGDTGVVEKSMPTSTDPPLGDWEIDVTVRGHTETKKFTIDKYVLPKFEATVEVPKVYILSEPGISGKAVAKYTFGKPLTEADVTVTLEYEHFWQRRGSTAQKPSLTRRGKVDANGELEFFFSKEELTDLARKNDHKTKPNQTVYLDWRRVKVMAEVTDMRTLHKMEAESMVQFTKDAAKVEILSLTPGTFKPGLRYTAYVKVTQADGTLFPNYQEINVLFNVTGYVPQPFIPTPVPFASKPTPVQAITVLGRRPVREKLILPREVSLFVENQPLTENGFLSVDVYVPANFSSITVKVEVLGVSRQRSAEKAASRSGNFLQITAQQHSPKVGQMAKLSVRTTEPVSKLIYQVYTKGVMVSESEATATDAEGQKFMVSFPVTAKMAPNCKVLAFYLRSDGEIVADSVSFKVDMSSADQVQISYGRDKVKPGEEVQMTVSARPDSLVFLLAVDKSVQLLKSGNDITQQMVSEELVGYDFGSGFHGYWRYMFICGWPYPSHGVDAHSIFRDAKVAMLTDGDLYRKPWPKYYGYGRTMMMARGGGAELAFSAPSADVGGPAPPPDSPAEKVRSFFPETWLWDIVLIGGSGQSVMKTLVPDTITTWMTSAFAVHPQHGLALVQQPAKLTTFKDLFVSLDMPYSAIRGEDLCLKSLAFNYLPQPMDISMVMAPTEGIENIRVRLGREYRRTEAVSRELGTVASNGVGEQLFCFTPTGLGPFPIRVSVTGTPGTYTDAVERKLLVEAEGTPRVTSIPVMLEVESGITLMRQVPIQFPPDTVKGSERITVSVAGDLLDPVFENIDDLLRMPYGCGEQNMLYFAPNVFLIDYMQNTDTYTPERAEKAENFMLIGYQKEIQYQHNDGSFSAFGNRKKEEAGSMWLTAFVVKCFAQSLALQGDVVSIEPSILSKAVVWMVSRQNSNGSFPEPGKVFNKNMQGGSAKGEALTAYVLIALAETKANFKELSADDSLKLEQSLYAARAYLEGQLATLSDPYDLAIVTYALHVTSSAQAEGAFQRLMASAVRDSLTLHWERSQPQEPQYYWQRQTEAINIEMTAYALLTFLARDDVAGGLAIVRWLTGQRGPQGGFISTQDTVIGLQALAGVATQIYQPSPSPLTVHVQVMTRMGPQPGKTLTLDHTTRGLLQKVVLPVVDGGVPSSVVIRAQGPGGNASSFAVAEVALDYNVLGDARNAAFRLIPQVLSVSDTGFVLNIRASRADGKGGSMTVIDVELLTGYDVDEEHPQYNDGKAKSTERMGRHYILYFDQIDEREVSVTLPMVVSSGLPVRPKPGVIRVYDYYENGGGQEVTAKYGTRGGGICSVQPKYEGCSLFGGLFTHMYRFLSRF